MSHRSSRFLVCVATAAVALVAALAVAGCGTQSTPTPTPIPVPGTPTPTPVPPSPATYRNAPAPSIPALAKLGTGGMPAQAVQDLVKPLSAFGLDLLAREAGANPNGNIVLSPASINDALVMTLNGARGQTAQQMQGVLLDGLSLPDGNQAWADLIGALHTKKDAQARIANSLWLRQGVPFESSFLNTNHDYFSADAKPLANDPATAANDINSWVDERTGGRITHLLDSVDPSTILILINSIYVKAGWANPDLFPKADTKPGPFTLPSGQKVDVPMMHGTLTTETGPVADTPEYVAVPVTANGNIRVTFVVPKGSETPESVVALLQKRGLQSLENGNAAIVDLAVPRFTARFRDDAMQDQLKAMGMTRALSQGAEFDGISSIKPLFISQVVHEAVLDVNEQGVEAAAGTAVAMAGAGFIGKHVTVTVDRPFVVLLSEGYSGAPLFMAIVRDPR